MMGADTASLYTGLGEGTLADEGRYSVHRDGYLVKTKLFQTEEDRVNNIDGKVTSTPYNAEAAQNERNYAAKVRTRARDANNAATGVSDVFRGGGVYELK